MPELPDAKRERMIQQYDLTDHDATVLLSESNAAEYFETVIISVFMKTISYIDILQD
jgi:Asp-tRNA(Asn)/Glu-tRNA(Gln) amidotransferase B subunit